MGGKQGLRPGNDSDQRYGQSGKQLHFAFSLQLIFKIVNAYFRQRIRPIENEKRKHGAKY